MRSSMNYSFSESFGARREDSTEAEPETPAFDSPDGLVEDVKLQFILDETNETYESDNK